MLVFVFAMHGEIYPFTPLKLRWRVKCHYPERRTLLLSGIHREILWNTQIRTHLGLSPSLPQGELLSSRICMYYLSSLQLLALQWSKGTEMLLDSLVKSARIHILHPARVSSSQVTQNNTGCLFSSLIQKSVPCVSMSSAFGSLADIPILLSAPLKVIQLLFYIGNREGF